MKIEHLSIDGQKIHANANFRKSYNQERLNKRYKMIKDGLKRGLSPEVSDDLKKANLKPRVIYLHGKFTRKIILDKISYSCYNKLYT